jgi:C1A family cysteine protease
MNSHFFARVGSGLAVLVFLAFGGCVTVTIPDDNDNGNTNGNTNTNDNGAVDPDSLTFGADQPSAAVVEARPQAINPYAANTSVSLPPAIDLTRDMPPVGDQGQLGSCTAWSAGYASASYAANRRFGWGADSPEHQASPSYLYERLLEQDTLDCGSGTFLATSMSLLIQEGCSSLDTVQYSDEVCTVNSSQTDAANFQIGSFHRVVPTDRYAMRGELAAGRVVAFGSRLYDDFLTHRGGSVFRGSGNFLTQNNQHAAHAMVVVGYDDGRGAYRVMNSWGTVWGDSGFVWMSFETFEETVFESYSIEPVSVRVVPQPPPGPPPEPEGFLDEAYQFAVADPVTRAPLVYLVFFWHFDAPVFIRSISVIDPNGDVGQQQYNSWYLDGYVYFVQTDGFQWTPGVYTVEFDAQTEFGVDILFTGDTLIAPLESGGIDPRDTLCSDLCYFAYDGICDDGGAGASTGICDFGTDCFDCGVRGIDGGGPDCNDECRYSFDGECDDGRPGAITAACSPGSDCSDCGPIGSNGSAYCGNSCPFAFDGECDDGGFGADYYVCEFGTDCADCGLRDESDRIGGGELCQDTCHFAFDGQCDDGGPGAEFIDCELGTDCFDCGARSVDDIAGECLDTCVFAFDGECDDGRAGAVTDFCLFGTDCTDCEFAGVVCEDTCFFAFDGECDDGGIGADFAECDLGSDCFDCGPRSTAEFKVVTPSTKPAIRKPSTDKKVRASGPAPVAKASPGVRMFRGVPIKTPPDADSLPPSGVRPTTLGANRKPVQVSKRDGR